MAIGFFLEMGVSVIIIHKRSIFQPAMFDYQKVPNFEATPLMDQAALLALAQEMLQQVESLGAM